MAEIVLTKEQQAVIDDRGGTLLVSAAAGSGKTKVLIDRVLKRVNEGCNVDEFLLITFTQAALGATVTVPTLDGKASYEIHEGTQPGDVFKLKGKGIQHLGGRGRGDQYVRVVIEVPKNLNSKQKELIRQFDTAIGDKNYQKRKGFMDKLKDIFG